MTRSNPGIHAIQVGDITVTALNDGQFEAATGMILGPSAEESEAMLRAGFRPLPPRITVSCFLLETPQHRVMIDAGAGGAYGALLGHAAAKLEALGVSPGSIDTVLLTHGHPDHLGGLIDAQGGAVFDRAELVVPAIEMDFWTSDANRAQAPAENQGVFDLASKALAAYGTRLRRIGDGAEVLPGITARHLPGHTPGHTGFRIGSGPGGLLLWADIIHLPGIQFARPDAGMVFDTDPSQARATRARIMEEAATDRLMVAGIHHDFPIFGYVARRGATYAFEPVVWSPTATGLAGG